MATDWETLSKTLGPQPAAYNGGGPLSSVRLFSDPRGYQGERRKDRQARLLSGGYHPLRALPLYKPAKGQPAPTCRACKHWTNRFNLGWQNDRRKCRAPGAPTPTGGTATDCKTGWPACLQFVAREAPKGDTTDGRED